MKPSADQKRILEWVQNPENEKKHLVINAQAGGGKSSSLKMIALALEKSGYTPDDIRICVFGKANAQDLVDKFGVKWKQSISTLHSIGWSILKQHLTELEGSSTKALKYKIDTNKYYKIADGLGLEFEDKEDENYLGKRGDFLKLVDLVRLTNKEPTTQNTARICNHFEIAEIEDLDKASKAVGDCLRIGKKQALSTNHILDFTDQIWLPVTWKLWEKEWFTTYKFCLNDEVQDMNASQLELAIHLVGTDGRLIFVGDKNQSIFGFSGADCNSIATIIERTKAVQLPLSTCYRCPKSHIELVKKVFPNILIKAFKKNKIGTIQQIPDSKLEDTGFLVTGDLILCRLTAPLVSLCILLISRGISAVVKGRAIGELLKSELKEVAKTPDFTYSDFYQATDTYYFLKLEKWKTRENLEQLSESLQDKLRALRAIYCSQVNASSINDLNDFIDTLFSDSNSLITLSTVHRAKGLEADRVFIIQPEALPLKWKGQNEWQLQQELNLLYVSLTRSKADLYIVSKNLPYWISREDFKGDT